jgi:cytoskeletal protein RodZ
MQTDLAHALAELHPGYLPKDLSQLVKEFKTLSPSDSVGMSGTSASTGVSPNAETNISYIPGFKSATQPGVEKKKSSSMLWILLVAFILIVGMVGGVYAAWVYVIQPKIAERLKPTPPPVTPPMPPPPAQPVAPPPPPQMALATPSMPPAESQVARPTESMAAVPSSMPASMPAAPESQVAVPQAATTQPSPESGKAPESQAATPPAAMGQAYVNSTPQGADIYLDDAPTGGKTPALISNLKIGQSYRIRLMKPGYMALEAVYSPTSADPQRLELPLRELPQGSARVPTQPSNPEEAVAPIRHNRRVYRENPSGGAPLHQTPPPKSGDMIIFR